MDMRIRTEVLQHYRQQKLWSQDELATASGLSLRTIQRVEIEGNVSLETLKALAAALDIDANSLLSATTEVAYSHTQIGWALLIILLLIAPLLVFVLQLESIPAEGISVPMLILVLVGLLFGSLRIQVNNDQISWRFGIGLIRFSEPVSEILSCTQVRNRWWWGLGIRFTGLWLYCVSGLDAVEVSLKSGKRLRLGTDEPVYLQQAIEAAIRQ